MKIRLPFFLGSTVGSPISMIVLVLMPALMLVPASILVEMLADTVVVAVDMEPVKAFVTSEAGSTPNPQRKENTDTVNMDIARWKCIFRSLAVRRAGIGLR